MNSSNNIITSNTNIANINPFRYRGYYFDDETGGEETVEGLCLTQNSDKFDDHFAVEVPTLQQLAVLILRSGE